jgi:hypothetical protein
VYLKNMVLMALSCNYYRVYSTLANFVASIKQEILPLIRDLLLVKELLDLLGGAFFTLD